MTGRAGERKAGRGPIRRSGTLLAAAKEAHAAGRTAVAESLYAQAVKTAPADAVEAYRCLAILCAQTGRLPQAVEHLRAALALDPSDAALLNDLGTLYQTANRSEDAIDAYRQAVTRRPDFAEAHLHLGTALHREGRLAEALQCYRRAIAIAPKTADPQLNLGVALQQLGNHAEAEAAFRRALAIDPRCSAAHFNLGITLAAQDRADAAIAAYRAALAIEPGSAPVHVNLGMVFHQKRELDEAVACFRRAVELDPTLAMAFHNLGRALGDLGRADEAIACYRRAVALDPESPGALRALAVALRDRGLTDDAFACFRRQNELVFRAPRKRGDSAIPPHRTKHDREQLDYLADRKLVAAAGPLREEMARAPRSAELLDDRFTALWHIEGGERIETAAINPRGDVPAIEAQWAQNKPTAVVVDDLLSPTALDELRRFCWGSTIWRIEYGDGYLGAMMGSGFAAPLIAQIAAELAAAFPRIFRGHPLLQSWAFKYDSALGGIGVHADFAAVNVNFWITPDEANLDPERGGLVIWDQPAPLDWDFEKYNKETDQIREFLARSNARSMTVPYRANRAVIFDSDLFHETDRIAFKEGYLNRRINVTFLYGVREHGSAPPSPDARTA